MLYACSNDVSIGLRSLWAHYKCNATANSQRLLEEPLFFKKEELSFEHEQIVVNLFAYPCDYSWSNLWNLSSIWSNYLCTQEVKQHTWGRWWSKWTLGMVIKEEGLGHRHPRCSCAFYELESKVTEQFSGRTHQGLRGVAFMVGACSLLLQSTLERAATQLIALNPPKLQREAESSSCRHVGSRSEVCLRGCSWGR